MKYIVWLGRVLNVCSDQSDLKKKINGINIPRRTSKSGIGKLTQFAQKYTKTVSGL